MIKENCQISVGDLIIFKGDVGYCIKTDKQFAHIRWVKEDQTIKLNVSFFNLRIRDGIWKIRKRHHYI